MVPILARAGDHFTDKAGQEKHDAQDDGNQGQIEQRLVRNLPEGYMMGLVYQFGHDQPHGDDAAHQEHQDAGETEEMHRLLAEHA